MERFGIYAPGYAAGMRQDFPHILMDSRVVSDLVNCRMFEGSVQGVAGRLKEFVEEVFTCSAPPVAGAVCVSGAKDVYFINIGTANNHPQWQNRAISLGASSPMTGTLDTLANNGKNRATHGTLLANASASKGNVFSITAVDTVAKKFTVAGDQTAAYTAADKVAVDGSTGNDGTYTIVSATLNAGSTDIVVTETVADATVDGKITDKGVIFSIGTSGTLAPMPDGYPALESHTFKISGVEYAFWFTKRHAYLWSSSWSAWIEKHSIVSADSTRWDIADLHERMYATNGVDKVLWWGATTTALLAVLDTANGIEYSTGIYCTKAVALCVYENYLLLGGTTENGILYPDHIRWCNYDDPGTAGSWKTGDAGAANIDGKGAIIGFGYHHSLLVIGKEYSAKLFWLVSGSDTFNTSIKSWSVGFLSGKCGITDPDGEFYFLASDYSIRSVDGEDISPPIRSFVFNINPAYKDLIRASYYWKGRDKVWAVPYGSQATANNRLIVLKADNKVWAFDDFAVTAFGSYSRTKSYTIDTIPFDMIDEWAWDSIDSTEQTAGFMPLCVSDASGNIFALYSGENDNGAAFERKFQLTTDLMYRKGLRIYKRVLEWRVIAAKASGSLTLWVKRDDESGWFYLGTVSLDVTEEIAVVDLFCDVRFKSCLLEVRGNFRFDVIGVEAGFGRDGER